ncbi:PREDICTED: high affinity immunoglobulin epsilon receptor subunit alpha isoform X2 [Chinchilla lanigera]|uniref:high affinity immunoglobulin epsilon receptor subunit alpha isoform X2 n=1 Tax=Chinchilla lanigera TaxID=34839 RepID=UPI0006984EA4|nr:PREDICTED: high affinity immunoglobulin epsilon receptor subunit alpha isoform X2 [Chinchilla lanigera]
MAAAVDGSALLWLALLLFSPHGMLMVCIILWLRMLRLRLSYLLELHTSEQQQQKKNGLQPKSSVSPRKSVISLSPPWSRIFEGENVTLTCNKNNPTEDSPTQWFHNDINLPTNTSNYNIVNASTQHSGKYECQNQNLLRSKPVHLEVFKDWLLLQTSAKEVLEGESLSLRCHGWKDWTVFKPIYYKDKKAFKYHYENNVTITIMPTVANGSGAYYCSGFFSPKHWEEEDRCFSEYLNITVIKDTWLYVSTNEQFKSFLKMKMTGEGNKLQNLHPVAEA